MKIFLKKFLRIFGWILAIVGAIPVLFYITLVIVNLKDDPLSPEVEKLLTTSPPAIDANTNGYFAWIGIQGPENEHPHAWGQRWFKETLQNDKQVRVSMQPVPHPLEKEIRQNNVEKTPCDQVETCLENVAAHPEAAREVLSTGKITLDRSNLALLYPVYQEPWRPDFSAVSVLPSYSGKWRALRATRFALTVAEGRHTEALEQLGWEMAFLKRQLQGSHGLTEKMIGIAYVRNHYLLLSQYMRRHPVETVMHGEQIQAMLAALPDETVSLKPCMQSEKRLVTLTILQLKDRERDAPLSSVLGDLGSTADFMSSQLANLLLRHVFLINHTVNENAEKYDAWIRADDQKHDAYRQALADAQKHMPKHETIPFRLRNPVGYVLVNVATPDFGKYYLRRDDLLALRSAVEFQLNLLRQVVIDGDKIAEILKAKQDNLRHPYSGAAPAWNKDTRQLSYPLIGDTPKNRQVVIGL